VALQDIFEGHGTNLWLVFSIAALEVEVNLLVWCIRPWKRQWNMKS